MTGPVLITITALVLIAVYGLWVPVRLVARTGGLHPTWNPPAPAPAPEPAPYQPPRPRKPGTPRGGRPPATPQLTTVQLSWECAEGMCGICRRTGGCMCSCDHNPAKIVARNAAEYDRTHGKVPA